MSSPPTHSSARHISELCLRQFRALPKTGKPTALEWTILAGVVLHDSTNGRSKVVALGAGTKCLGSSKLCPKGYALNDSHAEVLARRALIRFLYQDLRLASAGGAEGSLFKWCPVNARFHLRDGLTFHFWSSQTPCGDACIRAVDEEDTGEEGIVPRKRLKMDEAFASVIDDTVGCPLSDSSVFTGAKLLHGAPNSDAMAQTVGAVRTKPGRGDPTLSMSCSDKLSRWHFQGAQGALLSVLLDAPIYFASWNFCSKESREKDLKRAIYGRWQQRILKNDVFQAPEGEIRVCIDVKFEYAAEASKQPSPNGLCWCDIPAHFKPYEVSVSGVRQGVNCKKRKSSKVALKVSKFQLLREFVDVLKSKEELLTKFSLNLDDLEQLPYHQFKRLARGYQRSWQKLKTEYFQHWTQKPKELQDFSLDQCTRESVEAGKDSGKHTEVKNNKQEESKKLLNEVLDRSLIDKPS